VEDGPRATGAEAVAQPTSERVKESPFDNIHTFSQRPSFACVGEVDVEPKLEERGPRRYCSR